ncbi:MAG: hypothetical protein E7265_01070 [Lachnospiraceae bacterium]|nr:hypothetical protein [Lachnospiraceae bacterium]
MNYYSYDELINDIKRLIKEYNGLLESEVIGYSVLGRAIPMLRVGCGHINMFICAGIHGRESINTELLIKITRRYLKKYCNHVYFSKYCFNIIPLLNPDGYTYAMTQSDYYEYKHNYNNIDINRDFPSVLWQKSIVTGKTSASQPETKALISAFKSHPSIMFVDIHSRGNCIYYYRKTMDSAYNKRQLLMAQILAKYTGYILLEPDFEIGDNDTGGNSVHYYSEKYKMPAFTIETCDDNQAFPIERETVNEVYDKMSRLPEAMINSLFYCNKQFDLF